ncbi:TcdA/TcdB pore-forming domain-containing protein [Pleionea sp. CnH1-48]|uniref:TcdA/TcdB pore-forming domain-containing protein n=1 Tax=Pleionea sp. CnH1-48 TaxID=2954494 RepID=UPI002097A65C|nr:TcdA/TcdB pore-forming domain-containing protein [Pleionea sp. CnH1-48]MCO7223056.1 T3SS effector HopA1 family protein [Pleionea sp. CnH1-48]
MNKSIIALAVSLQLLTNQVQAVGGDGQPNVNGAGADSGEPANKLPRVDFSAQAEAVKNRMTDVSNATLAEMIRDSQSLIAKVKASYSLYKKARDRSSSDKNKLYREYQRLKKELESKAQSKFYRAYSNDVPQIPNFLSDSEAKQFVDLIERESLNASANNSPFRIKVQASDKMDRTTLEQAVAYRFKPYPERGGSPAIHSRLTLDVKKEYLPHLVEAMKSIMSLPEVQQSKIFGPSKYGKLTDNAVIYLQKPGVESALTIIAKLKEFLPEEAFISHVPVGMLSMQSGISYAEAPFGEKDSRGVDPNSSHGSSRAFVAAKAIAQSALTDQSSVRNTLPQQLEFLGYDKDNPALMMGSASRDLQLRNGLGGSDVHIQTLYSDPVGFLSTHTLDVRDLIPDTLAPTRRVFARLEKGEHDYSVRLTDGPEQGTVSAYFLGFNGASNPVPAFVDIPKHAQEGDFLFTGSLTGCSVIVTELNDSTYRVFHDARGESSAFYDNVVMALDYDQYKGKSRQTAASSYMVFKDGEWKLIHQGLQMIISDKKGYWGRRDGSEGNAFVQGEDRDYFSAKARETRFHQLRKSVQNELIKEARTLGISVDPLPADRVIDPNEPINRDNPAFVEWHQLREKVEEAAGRNSRIIGDKIHDTRTKLKVASGKTRALLEQQLHALRVTNDSYTGGINGLLRDSSGLDIAALWLDKKQREGTSSVVQIDPSILENINRQPRLMDQFSDYQGILADTLNAADLDDYVHGIEHEKDTIVPGWHVDMTTTEMINHLLEQRSSLGWREQGALVRRINENYRRTVYDNALGKTRETVTYMENYAEKVQLVPQDVILLAEPGRCLPLARMMATSIAQLGAEGVKQFSETLWTAAASPDTASSKSLYSDIASLHVHPDVKNAEIKKGSRLTLDNISSLLSRENLETGKSFFLLMNTQEHSMMVGKYQMAREEVFYFYDPNFAVFTFNDQASLMQGLNEHLNTQGYAEKYKAQVDEGKVRYEVRVLDTQNMSDIRLSSGFTVNNLLEPEATIPDASTLRDAHAIADIEASTSSDLKIKSALTLIESNRMAESFMDATRSLLSSEGLGENWLPVLKNVKQENGRYVVPVMNSENPELVRELVTDDDRIFKFKRYYDEALEKVRARYRYADGELVAREGVADVEHVDGLNAAFTIQSVIDFFNRKKNADAAAASTSSVSESLDKAIKAHTYINLAQVAHGTILDAAKIYQLYRVAVSDVENVTGTTLSAVSHTVNEGVGVLFGIANVVLDSYELANAQNETQREVFGTQLAFDSVSLVTSAAGITAGLVGASTAGAVLSGAGVIVGGLAVGFTALAQAFGEVADNAKNVGRYFDELDQSYSHGGYIYSDEYHAMVPYDVAKKYSGNGAVIREINLQAKEVLFDSQYIYRTHHGHTGSGKINYFFWAGDMPQQVSDKSQAINIRQGIGYGERADFNIDDQALVLPSTARSYIGYNYNLLPGSTTRNDTGFNIIRKLEEDKRFDYDFYIFPSEYTIDKLRYEYVSTDVNVILDKQDRQIVMPTFSQEERGHLHYKLEGSGANYHLVLNTGASLSLSAPSRRSRTQWVLDARQLDNNNISVSHDHLVVGGVRVNFNTIYPGAISVINKHNEIFSIDIDNQSFSLTSEDGSTWDSNQQFHDHLLALVKNKKVKENFVLVQNYRTDAHDEHTEVGRGYYDVKNDRFIYTNRPGHKELLSEANLVSVKEGKAWFLSSDHVTLWNVDIATGEVLYQYTPSLVGGALGTVHSSRVWEEHGNLYYSIEETMPWGQSRQMTYWVSDTKLSLVSVLGDARLLDKLESGFASNSVAEDPIFDLVPALPTNMGPQNWADSTFSEAVVVSGKNERGENTRYWVLHEANGLYKSVTARLQGEMPSDLILALSTITEEQVDVYYFYSHETQTLYYQQYSGIDKAAQTRQVNLDNIKSVFSQNEHLYVMLEDGSLLLMSDDGRASLVGVTQTWLSQHHENVDAGFKRLNEQYNNKQGSLVVLGLKDSSGAHVSAWYDISAQQFVMAGSNLNNKTLSYWGLDKQQKYAWILDADNNQLYRQPVLESPSTLTISEDLVVSHFAEQAVLMPEFNGNIESIDRVNGKLSVLTHDGVRLSVGEVVQVVGVTSEWRQSNEGNMNAAFSELSRQFSLADAVMIETEHGSSWYLPKTHQRLNAYDLSSDHVYDFLGLKVDDSGAFYVFDETMQEVYEVSSRGFKQGLGKYSVADVGAQDILALEFHRRSAAKHLNLPLIKGVNKLVISSTGSGHNYFLKMPTLAHYQQVVVDDRGRKNALDLMVDDPGSLLFSRSGDNLVLLDAKSDSSVLLTRADKNAFKKMNIVINKQRYNLYFLLKAYDKSAKFNEEVVSFSSMLRLLK